GAAARHGLPRRRDAARRDPAGAPPAPAFTRAGVRRLDRRHRGAPVHEGPAALLGRAAAGLRPPRAPASAVLRARVEARGHAAPGVPGQAPPHGNRRGRVRRHGRPRQPGGHAGGAAWRDRRRVRRSRATVPAGVRDDLPGRRQAADRAAECRDRPADLQRGLRHGRRLGPRPVRARAPTGRAHRDTGAAGDRREGRADANSRGARRAQEARAEGGGRVSFLWLAALCLLLTMFFSATEMAFIAANRLRLRHLAEEGSSTAALYLEAFRQPERALSTAMIGVTVAHIVAGSAVTWSLLPVLGAWAPLVATFLLTPVMLVFGEIIPKAIAREWATSLILKLYRPLTWAATLLVPFVAFAN